MATAAGGYIKRHPSVKWALGAIEFTTVDVMLFFGITPAWAAVVLPISDKVTINLGELPQWIVALVAAGGFWKAWKSEKASLANAAMLQKQGEKIDGMLADRDKGNVAKGEKIGIQAGVETAATLAEGQRQGREMVAAPLLPDGKSPVPVTDEAAQRVAKATETLAAVAEKTAEKK